MGNKMNFVLRTPAIRDSFWKSVNFSNFLLNLTQVARLVKGLMRCVLPIEVPITIDGSRQAGSVVFQVSISLEVYDTHDLLV